MTKFEQLNLILKNNSGFIRTAEAVENDISRSYFLEFVKANKLLNCIMNLSTLNK